MPCPADGLPICGLHDCSGWRLTPLSIPGIPSASNIYFDLVHSVILPSFSLTCILVFVYTMVVVELDDIGIITRKGAW